MLQECYVHNLLRVTVYLPTLRLQILELIVEKLLKLDVSLFCIVFQGRMVLKYSSLKLCSTSSHDHHYRAVVVSPGRQLSTTQQFAHAPCLLYGMEERTGRGVGGREVKPSGTLSNLV